MSVTNTAVELLLRHGPMAAGELGDRLWPDRTGRVSSSNGGGDYAAQMLLGRMRRLGLVRVQPGPGSSVWELTPEGRSYGAARAKRRDKSVRVPQDYPRTEAAADASATDSRTLRPDEVLPAFGDELAFLMARIPRI